MKKSIIILISVMAVALATAMTACDDAAKNNDYLYQRGSYTIYKDSIVDGNYSAHVINEGTIESNFNVTDSVELPEVVRFRFAINGEDNEMSAFHWHEQLINNSDSGVIHQFGVENKLQKSDLLNKHDIDKSKLIVRLDMRPVLRQLKETGYYVTRINDTIYQANFKGVWLTGDTPPLHSDVKRLHLHSHLQLKDRGDSIYELTVKFNKIIHPDYFENKVSVNSLPQESPTFISRIGIFDACYNIAVSRLDSLGKILIKPGYQVNTHDVSKAVLLSSGIISNDLAKKLLEKCVYRGRIHQDGGEGGGWPIVSDRLIWISAAYDLFNNSSDTTWLKYTYDVANRTLNDIQNVQLSPQNNLLYGASWFGKSFRRSYPFWATPSDIFETQSLLPNIVYYDALICMSKMAAILNKEDDKQKFDADSRKLYDSINQLFWIPNLQRYSEFLYCSPFQLQSSATDNLAQALAVINGPATLEIARTLIKRTGTSEYGIQRISPSNISNSQWDYNGNLIDCSTQAFWAIACSKVGNLKGLLLSIASIYRSTMLCSFTGAKINAENGLLVYESSSKITNQFLMCASVAAITRHVFIGFENATGGFRFAPSIPKELEGTYKLIGLRQKNSEWDITVKGTGNIIVSISIDGVSADDTFISDTVTGKHSMEISLAGEIKTEQSINVGDTKVIPETPIIQWHQKHALIENFKPELSYFILINGTIQEQISRNTYSFHAIPNCCVLQFQPVLNNKLVGLASRPKFIIQNRNIVTVPSYMLGATGTELPVLEGTEGKYIELSPARNKKLHFKINSKSNGRYFLIARYANGSGEENTQTRCVIRTVSVNGFRTGALILPCNGEGNWTKLINSNRVPLTLQKGLNEISIEFNPPYDLNSAGTAGTALIEWIKLIRID